MSAFDTLAAVPCAITAGDAVSWSETSTDYPPSSYSMVYQFAGATPLDGWQDFQVTGAESGSVYTFTFLTTYKPGRYAWEKRVIRTSDSVSRTLCRGRMLIKPNFTVQPTVTAAAAMLALLNTAITTLTTTVDQSVSFNGQSFTKANLQTLIEQRRSLQAEVYREMQAYRALTGDAQSPITGYRFIPQGYGYGVTPIAEWTRP